MKEKIEIVTHIFLKILTGIVTILIFFALYGFIQISIMDKDYASYFGYSPFEVKSGSMSPTINKSDMVIVKLTKNIKKNDIITFKVDSSYVTHRVTDIKENSIVTKGDYNNYEDKTISKKYLVGKVIRVFPKFGIWKKIILSPVVIISLLLAILLFSIGFSYEDKDMKKNNINIKIIFNKLIEKIKKIYKDISKEKKCKNKKKINNSIIKSKSKKLTDDKNNSKNKDNTVKGKKKSEVKDQNKKTVKKSSKKESKQKIKGNKSK